MLKTAGATAERIGSGTVIWKAREEQAAGRIDYREFIDIRRRIGALDRPFATPWARRRP